MEGTTTTPMTPAQFDRFIAQRERMLQRQILQVARKAVEEFLAADADGDDKMGLKYIGQTISGGPVRMGFREGIGMELTVTTAYKPVREAGHSVKVAD